MSSSGGTTSLDRRSTTPHVLDIYKLRMYKLRIFNNLFKIFQNWICIVIQVHFSIDRWRHLCTPSIFQFMKLSKCAYAYLTNYRFSIIAAKPLVESKNCTSMNFLRIEFPIKWHQLLFKNRKNDKSRQILGKWKFPQNTPLRENRFIVLV